MSHCYPFLRKENPNEKTEENLTIGEEVVRVDLLDHEVEGRLVRLVEHLHRTFHSDSRFSELGKIQEKKKGVKTNGLKGVVRLAILDEVHQVRPAIRTIFILKKII